MSRSGSWTLVLALPLIAASGLYVEASAQSTPLLSTDTIATPGGDILVTPILHASVQIELDGLVIQVDPWSRGDYSNSKRPNLILVTDTPGDHLDPETIAAIRGDGVPVLVPPSAEDAVPDSHVLANGETTVVQGVEVEAVPSYDMTPGEPFHPMGRGNGYVVSLGNRRIYFSGGGLECVPEVQALEDIDLAFIAMNLPNERMSPLAAARCVEIFGPRIVFPYHYRDANLEEFREALRDVAVDVRLANWYPGGATVGF